MSCVVRGCTSVWFTSSSTKFHSFPKDPERRKTWLSIVPLKAKFYESARICSKHFSQEYYERGSGHLSKNAIPFYDYELCECCNTTNCKNVPTTSQTKSSINCMMSSPLNNKDITNDTTISNGNIITKTDSVMSNTAVASESKNINGLLKQRVQVSDFKVQVKLKTLRERRLEKERKILEQKVRRQHRTIVNMQSLIEIVKNYASHSEIENILSGNYDNIRKTFKRARPKKGYKRYSDEMKAFALTLHFYSPKAYNFLRKYISLPHERTLSDLIEN